MPRRVVAVFSILLMLSLNGCVSPRRTVSISSGGGGTGQLYVSDQGGSAILRFSGATRATGNIAPAANISGASTQISNPQYIFVDSAANRLYVANLNGSNILVFEKVSTLNGNQAPSRVLTSTSLATPIDLTVDTSKDLLYVADNSKVAVFTGASTANGSLVAVRTIQLTFTPIAILLDQSNDRLFVVNNTGNAVDVFDGASTLNGTVTPNRTLSGTNTQLNQPAGVRIDGAGRLIVSNAGSSPSITIYNNAATITGNVAPTAVISGSNTTLNTPAQLALDSTTNAGELYVADPTGGNVSVFSNITTLTGNQNIAPSRTISGSATLLTGTGSTTARGVALDTTR